MNVEELSMIGPNVDLETVDAISKKRLLAFVNHFVVNTALFLNTISKSCEHGLMSLENKIQKLETSIVMLETKLNSVPGLEEKNNLEPLESKTETGSKGKTEEKNTESEVETNGESDNTKAQQVLDPTLIKYVKMLQFGVPWPAVKLKLEQENVPSSLHDVILNYNK